ncbi:galactan 5-O-arabinofuranosyltransferase [Rhodococcus tukisamuensis]|uniref:Galactan 5-O-arabinofuranosyltransferase n=2 Tax=Rhodococcus tukisamuensis TaxID=168276 RepID=A0A1G6MGJ6_9NOCA|nr:galactan 5-O-arabinofuranosyltransferase [Rhodococcus tukisamuensis]
MTTTAASPVSPSHVQPARRAASAAGEMVLAALVAVVVAAVGLVAFSAVQWPAFNSSNVTRALTTVGQVLTLSVLALSVWLLRRRRATSVARVLSWAGVSGFVTVTLGMPLAATKLYLHGVSVDQEFRTEFLTRMTDTAALKDMTYADLPSFYPAGWFWFGGRVANLLGMDGWEAFKPYAIASLAVASVIALVLWSRLIRADLAVLATIATTALTVGYASPEAYSAILVVLLPPVLLLAWGGLYRPGETGSGGWGAVVGTGLFLGLAATFYTLYLGYAAFAVTVMALVAAGLAVRAQGSWRAALGPLVRLAAAGVISGLIALIVWLPFLSALRTGTLSGTGSATHYLPEAGADLPLPMFDGDLTGALCLLGTVWLAGRAASSRRAQALGLGVVAAYLWVLMSMAATAVGTTLLSFRLEPVLIVLLGAAGVFGFVDFARWLILATSENPRVKAAVVAVGALGAVAFAQSIPHLLAPEITIAYTDTDGDGVRADQRPPGAAAYYAAVDEAIQAQRPGPRSDTVVLTADTSFLSFYPYFGFQGLTSHYANPLAQFDKRAAYIESWTELQTPDELIEAMDATGLRGPDTFVFRQSDDGYTLRLAEDVYPNDPNVRRYTVTFPEKLFEDPRFSVTEVGPFVVVTRVG